jgi:hypothetical protein
MYVEISGRQTGKSTRLADHASDELIQHINDPVFTIGLVSTNLHRNKRLHELIKDMFIEKLGYLGWGDKPIPNIDRKIKKFYDMVPIRENTSNVSQWYVDEFAFIHSDQLLRKDNAYYCTTPNGDHPFTISLLNHCRSRGIEVESYDISRELRNTFDYTPYINEFDDWCIEHQLEMYPHPFENVEFVQRFVKRHRF